MTINVKAWSTQELQALRDQINAELVERFSSPAWGGGRFIDPQAWGCCGRMPCQRTACPAPRPADQR